MSIQPSSHAHSRSRRDVQLLVTPVVAALALAAVALAVGCGGSPDDPPSAAVAAAPASSAGPTGVITYQVMGKGFFTARAEAPAAAHEPALWTPPAGPAFQVSPDQGFVAWAMRDDDGLGLNIASNGGSASFELARLAGPNDPILVVGKGEAASVGGIPLVVAWSPDSKRIAFGTVTLPYALTVATRATDGSWRLQPYAVSGGYVGELVWSPDGATLAISTYSLDRKNHTVLLLREGDDEARRLVDGCHITWSPGSRHMAVHRDPYSEPGAWVIGIDVGATTKFAISTDPQAYPFAWRPG